jgi:hypothetical protein
LTEWYVCNLDGTGCVLVNKGTLPILFIPPEFTGKSLGGVGRCPDPGAPVEDGETIGYGAPVPCTPIVVGAGENGATVFAEGAGTYNTTWLGFAINVTPTSSAPFGITVYPGNDDGFCGSGFARPWIRYVNPQGDTVNAPWSDSGCISETGVMNFVTIRFFPADGSPSTTLYP